MTEKSGKNRQVRRQVLGAAASPSPAETPKARGMLARWRVLILAVAPVLGYWTGNSVHHAMTGSTAALEIEASISNGHVLRIYVNNRWLEPQTTTVSTAAWTNYTFKVPSRLTTLRIDPPDSVMLVRDIRLRGGEGPVQHLPLSTLLSWPTVRLAITPPDPHGILKIEAVDSGYTMGSLALDVGRQTPFLPSWYRLNNVGFFWATLLTAVAVVACGHDILGWRPAAVVAIVAGATGVTYWAASALRAHLNLLPQVSQAVGYAALFGYPKSSEAAAVAGALLAGAVLSCLAGMAVYRHRVSIAPSRTWDWRGRDWVFLAVVLGAFVCASRPAASTLYQSALHAQQRSDIDSQNGLYWEYAASQGELPFRDFWYPYAGMYNEAIPLYPYIAHQWLGQVLLFVVIALSMYICLDASRTACLAIWAALLCMQALGVFWPVAMWRYLLSASIVLLGAAALQRRNTALSALFGVWTVYTLNEELSQPLYAFPAVAILLAATVLANRRTFPAYRRVLLAATLSGAVALAGYVAVLLHRGQFHGWLSFWAELPATSAYSAWPLDFQSWLHFPETTQQIYLALVVLLLVCGAVQAAASRFSSPVRSAPFCLGIVSAMQLQKEVIRPGISTQLLIVPAIGLALLVAQQLMTAAHRRRALAAGLYLGTAVFTVFFLLEPPARAQLVQQVNVFPGLCADLAYTLGHSAEWRGAAEHFFSPAALVYGPIRGDKMRSDLERELSLGSGGSVYVLGDRPDLYMLLGEPAPYYITLYNQSPLDAQSRTVEWLKARQPEYVLWDAQSREFDSVPNIVRVPLLFRYVLSHYVPYKVIGPFDVLRRARPEDAPDTGYWREKLGSNVPLGYIPSLSQAETDAAPGGAFHYRYLIVRSDQPVDGRVRTVAVDFGGMTGTIQFVERQSVSTYFVNLERVPWADLETSLPVLSPQQEPGLQFRVTVLTFAKERLY
jgi:hypothetical protein